MMKKRNGILTGLIAACAACVISAASCSQSLQTSNKPTLTELASVRYLIGAARAAVGFTFEVVDLKSEVERLRQANAHFRHNCLLSQNRQSKG